MVRALILGLLVLLGTASAGYAQVAYTFTSYDWGSITEVNGINNRGQLTGSLWDHSEPPSPYRGFVATEFGLTSVFNYGVNGTGAQGINDSGQIVGWYSSNNLYAHGFLRSADGSFTSFDVPSATSTFAMGINGTGQIVGQYSSSAN